MLSIFDLSILKREKSDRTDFFREFKLGSIKELNLYPMYRVQITVPLT